MACELGEAVIVGGVADREGAAAKEGCFGGECEGMCRWYWVGELRGESADTVIEGEGMVAKGGEKDDCSF